MNYFFLFFAITSEIVATLMLPASQNFTKFFPSLTICLLYFLSFYLLTFALEKLPIFIVYSTWSGLGIFFITLFDYFIYEEKFNWQLLIGLVLIALGVILVNVFKIKS